MSRIGRIWHNHGLSIVLFACFLLFTLGQSIAGYLEFNDEQRDRGWPTVDYWHYLGTGHFVEGLSENWESEFLQLSAYIVLTALLYQKGSSESKDPDQPAPDKPKKVSPDAPWPVRRGGLALKVYKNSLSIAMLSLFLLSFVVHAQSGVRQYNLEQMEHGKPVIGALAYLATSQFWFESFQNWQSEFFAIWAMVIFSIYLRQEGSPESKPVEAPHHQTGEE